MPSLLKECKKLYGSNNLYDVLNISKTATESEVKKAYYRLSLKVHPDRASEDEKENCTKKFQVLGKLYGVLSDKEKRKVYDETGEIDEEDLGSNKDWDQYWRVLFKKVSVHDIIEFENKYKDSDEERNDLKDAYVEFEGDMGKILDNIMCATDDDEDRFIEIINGMIKSKEVQKFKTFTSSISKKAKSSRKRKATKEAEEAEELQKELGLKENNLEQLIQQRQAARANDMNNFFDNLASKYATKGKKKK